MDITVDTEFASLIPQLSADERAQLERNIIAEGCREPLVTWAVERVGGTCRVLLDGHNRLGICRTNNIEFQTKDLGFEDRDAAKRWMLENQLGRRNLSLDAASMLRGKLVEAYGLDRGRPSKETKLVSFTLDQLSDKLGVSATTLKRDAKFSRDIDDLAADLGDEFRQEVLSRDTKIARKEVAALAALPKAERKAVADKLVAGEADSVRDIKKHELAADLNSRPLPQATGRFNVIVIDPPWQYEKRAEDSTHRGRNPYPDMDLDAIKAIDVAARAEDNCIVWLWTTNAFMREAFECLDAWGFRNKTILTWAKDRMGTGDWLRGKTEHCLMAVRGKPIVLLTNQTTVFEAPLREHSRKPDEFFAMVEVLCPGTRLEMFAREPRHGWQSWGAEANKFSKGDAA